MSELTALEKTRSEARAKADAEVDAKIARFKHNCLKAHLSAPYRTAGQGTPPGCLDPITLTEAEQKAVLAGISGKSASVKEGEGLQDSVDVCVEYLKSNKEAAADYKARVKG